mgnify:CR=1 FL=1|jgi:flagellar hook-length control protein FliK
MPRIEPSAPNPLLPVPQSPRFKPSRFTAMLSSMGLAITPASPQAPALSQTPELKPSLHKKDPEPAAQPAAQGQEHAQDELADAPVGVSDEASEQQPHPQAHDAPAIPAPKAHESPKRTAPVARQDQQSQTPQVEQPRDIEPTSVTPEPAQVEPAEPELIQPELAAPEFQVSEPRPEAHQPSEGLGDAANTENTKARSEAPTVSVRTLPPQGAHTAQAEAAPDLVTSTVVHEVTTEPATYQPGGAPVGQQPTPAEMVANPERPAQQNLAPQVERSVSDLSARHTVAQEQPASTAGTTLETQAEQLAATVRPFVREPVQSVQATPSELHAARTIFDTAGAQNDAPQSGDHNAAQNQRQQAAAQPQSGATQVAPMPAPQAGAPAPNAAPARTGVEGMTSKPGHGQVNPVGLHAVASPAAARQAALARLTAQAPVLKQGIAQAALIPQATKALTMALKQGEGTVTLRLTPENLGALKVEVSLQGQSLSARLHATTESARQLLLDAQSSLRAALEARGLSVERIEVTAATPAESAQDAHKHTLDDRGAEFADDGRSREREAQPQQDGGARNDAEESEAEPPSPIWVQRPEPILLTLGEGGVYRLHLDALV